MFADSVLLNSMWHAPVWLGTWEKEIELSVFIAPGMHEGDCLDT